MEREDGDEKEREAYELLGYYESTAGKDIGRQERGLKRYTGLPLIMALW